jgi:hypothetical protein
LSASAACPAADLKGRDRRAKTARGPFFVVSLKIKREAVGFHAAAFGS